MQKDYHILALGGIGMSALARLLNQKGHNVSGEDKNSSVLLNLLKKEGIDSVLEKDKKTFSENTHIITSSAIGEGHPQILQAKEKNLPVSHRTEILNELLQDSYSLLVAGTHGKTTTSSLLAHTLLKMGENPSFALGGILKELNTNAFLGKGRYFVAEADESDGSFIHLKKDAAIVTNLEEDHLDFWKTKEDLIEGFISFCKQVKHLVYCIDDPVLSSLVLKGISYGVCKKADFYYENCEHIDNGMVFDIVCADKRFEKVFVSLHGEHNVKNTLSVFALLYSLGLDSEKILKGFSSFHGVKRRMDIVFSRQDLELIDDYAHHPTEIEVTLSSLRNRVKERRILAVFQPHRSDRLKKNLEDFSKSFKQADLVLCTDVYEVGEKKEVDLLELVQKIDNGQYVSRDNLEKVLKEKIRPFDVVITLGAGDVNKVLEPLKNVQKTFKVALLSGGPSKEHDISLISAKNFLEGLLQPHFEVEAFYLSKEGIWKDSSGNKLDRPSFVKELCRFDVCVPCFHGPFGEDGTIQGFLKTLNIPFVSAGHLPCAISMNKAITKRLVESEGIATSPFIEIQKQDFSRAFVLSSLKDFTYPLFVKSCNSGSSYGVYEVEDEKALFSSIEKAFSMDNHLIIEQKIVGKEVEVAVLGNSYIEVGAVAEIPLKGAMYTFETKYGENCLSVQVPAKIDPDVEKELKSVAIKIYKLFHFTSHARIDFFIQGKKIILNEINAIPGMTNSSAFPRMFKEVGKDLYQLVNELVILALAKK